MRTQLYLTPATNEKPGEVIEVQNSGEEQQYLTPATPDKPGELVSLRRTDVTTQQFAEPVPYFSANHPQITELRAKVQQAETTLRHARSRNAPSKEIARLEGALRSLKAELDSAEKPKREERGRQQSGNAGSEPPTTKNTIPWDRHLAELDAKLAAHNAAATSSVCCSGPYKCGRCQAKASA